MEEVRGRETKILMDGRQLKKRGKVIISTPMPHKKIKRRNRDRKVVRRDGKNNTFFNHPCSMTILLFSTHHNDIT
jgi:hypothetical protein